MTGGNLISQVLRRAGLAAAVLFSIAPAEAVPPRSAPTPVAQWSAEELASDARLHAIGRRLVSANPEKCRGSASQKAVFTAAALSAVEPIRAEGCGGRFVAVPSNDLNAWADGRNVYVTTRMMRMAAEDDELAFVIAHEAAHNILHHAEELKSVAVPARVKRTEIEADGLAIELLAKAGFDLTMPERFLRRVMTGRSLGSNSTHPDRAERIATIRWAADAYAAPGTRRTR